MTTRSRLPLLLCLPLFVAVICIAQKPELFVQSGHNKTVFQVVFSPDGKMLASGSADNTVALWDVATGHQLRTLKGHDGGYSYNQSGLVTCVAFSEDGKTLAASVDNTIRLWDVTTGQELYTIRGDSDGITAIAFSGGGKTLVSINDAGTTIKTWDRVTGQELKSFTRRPGPSLAIGDGRHLSTCAFSRDGQTLAIASGFNIELWELATGRKLHTLTGHVLAVAALAFSGDGKSLASGDWGNTVKLWEVATGREGQTITVTANNFISSVALSHDGRTLASVSNYETVKLWDAATGREVWTSKTQAILNDIAFSPDDQSLAGGDESNAIKVWEATGGRELQTLAGHSKGVNSIALSNDG
jgi:WD40 repeat protein